MILLYELSKDDVKNSNYVKLLDKKYWYYIDKNGSALRHAKIVFKTHKLQSQLVKQWRYHDPTKIQDKCIEVLLGKIGNKWYPISTLRKLNPSCILKHPDTYAIVPFDVYRKALNYSDKFKNDPRLKKAILSAIKRIKQHTTISKKKLEKEKPIFIKSIKDLDKID